MNWLRVLMLISLLAGCGSKEKTVDEKPTEQPESVADEDTPVSSEDETPATTEPVDPSTLPAEERKAICMEKIDAGPCEAALSRWAYDHEKVTCEQFTYGGCQGTRNNFRSEEACVKTCSNLDGEGDN